MEKTIICIGREYGSGGHAIGQIMTKTVSSQSQRNAASKVKSKNIWKSSR